MDIRIYYEDTGAAGVVYPANYIKFLERSKPPAIRQLLSAEIAERP